MQVLETERPASKGAGRFRLLRWLPLCPALLALLGCEEPTAPREPPYIAIVTIFSAPEGTSVGERYSYRVSEISGTLHFDKTYRVAPEDTVIAAVRPATYLVSLGGLPPQCLVQDGPDRFVYVPDGINTAMVRYQISCQSQLSLMTGTDGFDPDQSYIYRINGPSGEQIGIIGANDTLRVDGLTAGAYDVALSHISPNCVVTSDGGREVQFTVGDTARTADFRIICSEETRRPKLLSLESSYHDGASGFMFRVADPDRDVERYFWDITDCHERSVLQDGGRLRRGLSTDRIAGQDTALVFGAIELGMPDADMAGRCTAIRVEDERGNTTTLAEELIGNESGSGPVPTSFNALFSNTAQLSATLQIDPQSYAGSFIAARLRDGALTGSPDGQPDIGVYNTVGFTDVLIPTVPLGGGRPPYYDYYAVIAYVFNGGGNFTRIEDDDLFH